MKLRIRGDSLRLRLTKDEVKKIAEGVAVEETTHFFNGTILTYALVPSEVNEISAEFSDKQIFVRVPSRISLDWAQSDMVAIKHEVSTPDPSRSKLFILIEKDFTCLKVRQNEKEDESNLFENPNAAHGSCQ